MKKSDNAPADNKPPKEQTDPSAAKREAAAIADGKVWETVVQHSGDDGSELNVTVDGSERCPQCGQVHSKGRYDPSWFTDETYSAFCKATKARSIAGERTMAHLSGFDYDEYYWATADGSFWEQHNNESGCVDFSEHTPESMLHALRLLRDNYKEYWFRSCVLEINKRINLAGTVEQFVESVRNGWAEDPLTKKKGDC